MFTRVTYCTPCLFSLWKNKQTHLPSSDSDIVTTSPNLLLCRSGATDGLRALCMNSAAECVCVPVTQAPRGTLQLNWRMPRSDSRERLRPLPQRCRRSNVGISMKRGKRWNRCSQKLVGGGVFWAYVHEVNKFENPMKVLYAVTVWLMYHSLSVIQSRRSRERQTLPASVSLNK